MTNSRENILLYEGILDKILKDSSPTISQCGRLVVQDPKVVVTSLLHYNRVVYVLSGKAYLTREGKKVTISSGNIIHIEENEEVTIEKNCMPFEVYYINFKLVNTSAEAYNRLMSLLPKEAIFDSDGKLLNGIKELVEVCKRGGIANYYKVKALFDNLLVDILRTINSSQLIELSNKPSNTLYIYNQAHDFIVKNKRSDWKVSTVAKHLGVSEAYLYQVFIRHAGKSPQDSLSEYRSSMAKDYLKYDDLSIKEIAYELGFSSPNHFSAYFKLNTGYKPCEYRRVMLKQNKLE